MVARRTACVAFPMITARPTRPDGMTCVDGRRCRRAPGPARPYTSAHEQSEHRHDPHRRRRLDLRTVARRVLSGRPSAEAGAGIREPPPHLDRGQRHFLRLAKARDLRQVARRNAAGFRVLAESAAVRDESQDSRRSRQEHRAFLCEWSGESQGQARPDQLAAAALQEIRSRRISAPSSPCCPATSRGVR